MKFFSRISRILKRDYLRPKILKFVRKRLGLMDDISAAREKVLVHLLEAHDATVAYGPFKGMKLNRDLWWGKYDIITKMLGTYERHVLNSIVELGTVGNGPFIDIGAADGYYAVGVAKSGLFDQVYAYEISDRGRESLHKAAMQNQCAEKIIIKKEANFDSLKLILDEHTEALILIDIEAGEYSLLSDKLLKLFRKCTVIVELHPWLIEGGYEKQEALKSLAGKWFEVGYISSAGVNPNQFVELRNFSDSERLLAMSEDRGKSMEWMLLTPKQQ